MSDHMRGDHSGKGREEICVEKRMYVSEAVSLENANMTSKVCNQLEKSMLYLFFLFLEKKISNLRKVYRD